MILKVEDALKSFRRTDPECEACWDLRGSYSPPFVACAIACASAKATATRGQRRRMAYKKKQYAFEIPPPLLVPKRSLTGLRGGSLNL